MIVEIIPCLSDNYSYLIYEKETGTVSIVDPSEINACDRIINKDAVRRLLGQTSVTTTST